jgi:hypothetical protein
MTHANNPQKKTKKSVREMHIGVGKTADEEMTAKLSKTAPQTVKT